MKFAPLRPGASWIPGAAVDSEGFVEATQWFPNRSLPAWCAYLVDPGAVAGRLSVVMPNGEGIANGGDVLVLANCGRILIVEPKVFFDFYEAAGLF